jgi:hypothetical protein
VLFGRGQASEQNDATFGCLSLPGLTGQSSRIINFPLNNLMDHPVKPDDDLIAYNLNFHENTF